MSTVSIDDVKKLAVLSALQVTDEEAIELQKEVEAILSFVEQLDSVDTKDLEPTYQVTGLKNVTRADQEIDYNVSKSDLLKSAPAKQDDQIKVKRVL